MAYGNWGAFVFRDGERMPQWEDNTPYRESEAVAGYWQAFMRGPTNDVPADLTRTAEPQSPFTHGKSGFDLSPHHAVLGWKAVRLCGYKSYAKLFVNGAEVDLEPYVTERHRLYGLDEEDPVSWAGEIVIDEDSENTGVYRFAIEFDTDTMNIIDLALVEPDGARWTSRCGYCIGAGHEESSDARDVVSLLPKEAT